jgi:hypothetical protein
VRRGSIRVLFYNEDEWAAFLDGANNGQFDDAAGDE